MKHLLILFAIVLQIAAGAVSANSLTVITYHDITANTESDKYAVSRSHFVEQMDYLKANDYHPVSLAFLSKVQHGEARLPQKSVLLSFDDGLQSYQEFVVPILKLYNYPSVSALVTGWLDGQAVPREYENKLMTWDKVRELAKSEGVEFVSHTHSLHRGVLCNAHGNEQAAAITRQFFPFDQSYETVAQYRQRLKYDLGLTVLRFVKELGHAPVGIAWPYGRYNRIAAEEATKLGMQFQLTLEDGPTLPERFPFLNRFMLVDDPDLERFANEMAYAYRYDDPYRFVELSLEPFIGLDKWKQDDMLGRLLDELQRRQINMAIVSAFSDDGTQAFFANDQMKVATDILGRVLQQITERVPARKVVVKIPGDVSVENMDRLYEDLASLNTFNGVLIARTTDTKSIARIKRIMGQYRPQLEYGMLGSKKGDVDYDFIVYPLQAATAEANLKTVIPELERSSKLLFVLLRTDAKTDSNEMKNAITALQVAGVRHYGYRLDTRYYGSGKSVASN